MSEATGWEDKDMKKAARKRLLGQPEMWRIDTMGGECLGQRLGRVAALRLAREFSTQIGENVSVSNDMTSEILTVGAYDE